MALTTLRNDQIFKGEIYEIKGMYSGSEAFYFDNFNDSYGTIDEEKKVQGPFESNFGTEKKRIYGSKVIGEINFNILDATASYDRMKNLDYIEFKAKETGIKFIFSASSADQGDSINGYKLYTEPKIQDSQITLLFEAAATGQNNAFTVTK